MRSTLAAAALLLAPAARAEVVAATPQGFEVARTVRVDAAPGAVWRTLVRPETWWNGAHTWSGDASNLSLEARPGGCFCERLPGGGVEHLRVVYLDTGKQLRLSGGLGPLGSEGVAGAMTFTLGAAPGGGTTLRLRYVVGGYLPGGAETLAAPVDRVLGEQLDRLAAAARGG